MAKPIKQPRIKSRFAAKPKEQTQLDRIEDRLKKMESRLHITIQERYPSLDNIQATLSKIESSVAVIRSGASFMQELEKDTTQLTDVEPIGFEPVGLQPGDYCDASKEVADELTAMGFEWHSDARIDNEYIRFGQAIAKGKMINTSMTTDMDFLDTTTFLSRARVTANELGLKPVEVWVPKVGDWVVWDADIPIVTNPPLGPHQVTESAGGEIHINRALQLRNGVYWAKDFRPATAKEIAAHLKEQEQAKKTEALKFGVRVMTPDGEGVYSCEVVAEHHHMVLPNGWTACKPFHIDDITILP